MSCERPHDLAAHAFGARTPEAEEHVAECAECRAELERMARLRERLGSLPEVAPSADFTTRTRAAFLQATPDFKPLSPALRMWRVFSEPSWPRAIALHAAVLAVALVTYASVEEPKTPTTVAPPPVLAPLKGAEPEPAVTLTAAELAAMWDKALDKDVFRDFMNTRREDGQRRAQRALYGGEVSARAVEEGLAWLAKRQDDDGGWGLGDGRVSTSATVVLALLAEGNTPGRGTHSTVLMGGLEFLMKQQDGRGRIGPALAGHAPAAAALVEAAMLSGDSRVRHAAEAAVAHLMAERKADGWGSDATTAWAAQALRLSLYLDTYVAVPALAHVRPPMDAELPPARRAARLWARMMASPEPGKEGVAPLAAQATKLERRLTTQLFGTLALYQVSGDAWKDWNMVTADTMAAARLPDGSWPANYDLENPDADAETTTALCTLILQTYYRYPAVAR